MLGKPSFKLIIWEKCIIIQRIGLNLLKIIPDYTENPRLEDIFAPPTMDYA